MKPKLFTTKNLVLTAVMAALASVLMFLEFPLPFMPPFLKFDFSDIPVFVAALAVSPVAGVLAALIKNLLHLGASTTGGVGEIANFLITLFLVVPPAIIWRKYPKKLFFGFGIGILAMSLGAVVANYFFLIPFFATFTPMQEIIAWCQSINPAIHNTLTLVLYGIVPFNIVKGMIVCVLSYFVLLRLRKHKFGQN